MLKDWQVLESLNAIASTTKSPAAEETPPNSISPGDQDILARADVLARAAIPSLDLPFRQPELELLGIIATQEATP